MVDGSNSIVTEGSDSNRGRGKDIVQNSCLTCDKCTNPQN